MFFKSLLDKKTFEINPALYLVLILQGHEKESLKLMSSYLPKDGGSGSAYQEGGGLYALGMYSKLLFSVIAS